MWGDTLEGGDTRVKAIKSDSEQKRSPGFSEKMGVTPSVAAPDVTHPSEATVNKDATDCHE